MVENIARKHGISKSDLLEREADDLAVRIALGETQVIAETKKYLATSGVNIAALEEFASRKNNTLKRSNHVILVKNLPYGSSEGDLANMFGKFGSLDKIVLPGTKALALVCITLHFYLLALFTQDLLALLQNFLVFKLISVDHGSHKCSSILVIESLTQTDTDEDKFHMMSFFFKKLLKQI